MKSKLLILIFLITISCTINEQNQIESKEAIIELVLFKTNTDIKSEDAKNAMIKLNKILSKQKGFISRKTSISKDGQFLDLLYWTDLVSAQNANKKVMEDTLVLEIFNMIDQKQMTFDHFETFNNYK